MRCWSERWSRQRLRLLPESACQRSACGRTLQTPVVLPAPNGPHRPIMLEEVVRCLRPAAGDIAFDCTLGGGGHAEAILRAVQPAGRLIGVDADGAELLRTELRLRAAGFGPDTFVARHRNFGELPRVLAEEGLPAADVIL